MQQSYSGLKLVKRVTMEQIGQMIMFAGCGCVLMGWILITIGWLVGVISNLIF